MAHGFQEWQRFDVAHRATDFNDCNVNRICFTKTRTAFDEFLNFVGDMRNNLHRFAQIVATAFFVQHALVNLARGEIVGLAHARFDETLIVTQVQVGFRAIIRYKHFAMLQRRHGARVDVEVRV